MPKARIEITTFGCRVNQYESETMSRRLAESLSEAELPGRIHILNACSVTALAEKKARQAARRLRREHPGIRIVLAGCLADAVERGLTQFEEADLIVGNAWKPHIEDAIVALIHGSRGVLDASAPAPLDDERTDGPADRIRAFLKVQDGCSGVCTYCRPTQLRGPSRSKSVGAAAAEAHRLIDLGFPEIVLTGINLAEYGAPDGDLAELIGSILDRKELLRLRLASINAAGITDRLLAAMRKDRRACRHFHIPLQSGSDRILRRMARPASVAEYLDRIAAVRDTLPDATFATDLIVGFPGEEDDDFAATCDVVSRVGYVNLHAFRYSPRPGTPAHRLPGALPDATKRRRAELLDRQWKMTLAPLLDERVGRTEDILTEACHDGHGYGYTSDYLYVSYTSSYDIPIGRLRPVRITSVVATALEGMDEYRAHAS